MLALFHGPTGCAAQWNPMRAHLPPALRLNCFAPELDYAGMTLDQIAAEMRNHLAPRKLKRLVLVGHGLGGAVALRLADMANEVILVAPPSRIEEALIPTHPQTGEIWIEGLAHRPEHIPQFDFHRAVALHLLATLLSDSADPAVLGRLRAEGEALLSHPAVQRGEVRLVTGSEDRVAPVSDLQIHAPRERVRVLPGAGHLLPLEVPQSLARLLGGAHGVVSPLTRPPAEVSIAS